MLYKTVIVTGALGVAFITGFVAGEFITLWVNHDAKKGDLTSKMMMNSLEDIVSVMVD